MARWWPHASSNPHFQGPSRLAPGGPRATLSRSGGGPETPHPCRPRVRVCHPGVELHWATPGPAGPRWATRPRGLGLHIPLLLLLPLVEDMACRRVQISPYWLWVLSFFFLSPPWVQPRVMHVCKLLSLARSRFLGEGLAEVLTVE